MFEGIATFYKDGGIWMHPITVCSVVGFAIAIERTAALFFRYSINSRHFMAQVQKFILANDIEKAINLCNSASKAALPRVIKAGLTRANKSEIEISNAVEEATLEVLPEITVRTNTLPNIANLATLLGLLGTIISLIEAFTAVALAPPDQKSQLLTQALAIGLNTTAWGLLVAIPITAVFIFLNGVTKRLIDEIDQYSVKLQNLLVARGKGTQSPLDR
jgi:biopolymer transport protein ExbB